MPVTFRAGLQTAHPAWRAHPSLLLAPGPTVRFCRARLEERFQRPEFVEHHVAHAASAYFTVPARSDGCHL